MVAEAASSSEASVTAVSEGDHLLPGSPGTKTEEVKFPPSLAVAVVPPADWPTPHSPPSLEKGRQAGTEAAAEAAEEAATAMPSFSPPALSPKEGPIAGGVGTVASAARRGASTSGIAPRIETA